jgi:hypothetical protein
VGGHAVVVPARDLVALLVGEELLHGIGLLRIGDHPVAQAFPRRVRVRAEHQLAHAGRHLQQLRAGGVRAERRVDLHPGGDLSLAVHDHRLAAQHLAVDLIERQRGVAARRRAHAPTRVGVDRLDLGVRIVERPLDALQLFPLHVENRVREVHQLAGVVPVAVPDDDLGHVVGAEAEHLELLGQRRPVGRAGHLQVFLLLPAGVVQDQVLAALDDADVDRQIDRVDVVGLVGGARHVSAVGHECAERHVHEPAALDQPYRAVLGLSHTCAQPRGGQHT